MSPQDALSASHHTPLDGSGVAPGGCPRISKGGSFLPRPHPRQSAHCSPCSQSNSDDVPRPHPARRLPIFPTAFPTNLDFSIHFFVLVPRLVPPAIPGHHLPSFNGHLIRHLSKHHSFRPNSLAFPHRLPSPRVPSSTMINTLSPL